MSLAGYGGSDLDQSHGSVMHQQWSADRCMPRSLYVMITVQTHTLTANFMDVRPGAMGLLDVCDIRHDMM